MIFTELRYFVSQCLLLVLLLLSAIPSTFAADQDLSSLLTLYKNEADLSHKTKKEGSGNLVVFTRVDLERMQVRYLYELIKRLPFLNYMEDQRGYANLFYENMQPADSAGIRVFINDHEVVSPFYGNSLGLISHMDLSFIDHIEFYQGYPSFELSLEPALMVLKLYSKNPDRELGGRVSLDVSTRSSYNSSFSYAGNLEKFSYYTHVNNNYFDRNKIRFLEGDLSKNQSNSNIYASAENTNHQLEFQALKTSHDDFMGHSSDALPQQAESESRFYHLGWRSYLGDKSVKLRFSYSNLASFMTEIDDKFLSLPPYLPKQYTERTKETRFTALLQKSLIYKQHDFLMGLQYRENHFEFEELNYYNTAFPPSWSVNLAAPWQVDLAPKDYSTDRVAVIFLEEGYALSSQQRLILSGKYSEINRNGGFRSDNISAFRLGYVFNEEMYGIKIFHSDSDMPIDPFLLDGYFGNKSLKNERVQFSTVELYHKVKGLKSRILFYKVNTENLVHYDFTTDALKYINLIDPVQSLGSSVSFRYNTSLFNYFEVSAYVRQDTISAHVRQDTYHGGHIRYVGSHGKWDLFAEIIWRDATNNLINYEGPLANNTVVDVNSSLTYHLSKDLSLIFKGENLLDDSVENNLQYANVFSAVGSQVGQLDNIPTTERQFWLSLEYLF